MSEIRSLVVFRVIVITCIIAFYAINFIPAASAGLEKGDLFPFAGGIKLPANDDGFVGPVKLNFTFPFFNDSYSSVYVNTNGAISFLQSITAFTPSCGPLQRKTTMITPYWSDVDTKNGGFVSYTTSTNPNLLNKAWKDISKAFPILNLRNTNELTHLFITSWIDVSFYNSNNFGCNKANTFQAILATNQVQSFVLFYYGKLTWTAGMASEGNCAGLDGHGAKAGFDVGDGRTFHELAGSCTADILQLANSSNINENGKWVFRVDNNLESAGTCKDNPENLLQIDPPFITNFGQQVLKVTGPCLNNGSSNISLTLLGNSLNVISINYKQSIIYIQIPILDQAIHIGRINLELEFSIPNPNKNASIIQKYFGYIYVTGNYEPDFQVKYLNLNNSTAAAEANFDQFEITWNLKQFPSQTDLLTLEVYGLISSHNDNTTFWSNMGPLYQNISNSGKFIGNLLPFFRNYTDQVALTLIKFGLRPTRTQTPTLGEGSHSLSPRRQKRNPLGLVAAAAAVIIHGPELFANGLCAYANKNSSTRAAREKACDDWYKNDPGPPTDIEHCPPTYTQADADDRFVESYWWTRPVEKQFHVGGSSFFRQAAPSPSGGGQQCVYNSRGNLLVDPIGGGTADAVSPSLSEHYAADVAPYCVCCGLFRSSKPSASCNKYMEKRPIDDGTRYKPKRIARAIGDPHLTTFDSFSYMFNGAGEFWMVKLVERIANANIEATTVFRMQVRMEQIGTRASISTGYALYDGVSLIEVYSISSGGGGLIVMLDKIPIPFSSRSNDNRLPFHSLLPNSNCKITLKTDFQIQIVFQKYGIGFTFIGSKSGRNINLIATAAESEPLQKLYKTVGLLGVFDNALENDLTTSDGTILPLNSTTSTIHYDFGLSWMITANESLFTYEHGKNWTTYAQAEFKPMFNSNSGNSGSSRFNSFHIPSDVRSICGNNADCIFDWIATGSLDFANETLEADKQVQSINTSLSLDVKACKPLLVLENGFIHQQRDQNADNSSEFGAIDFVTGSELKVGCNSGYQLNEVIFRQISDQEIAEVATVKCADGNWKPGEPSCQAIRVTATTAPQLQLPKSGTLVLSLNAHNVPANDIFNDLADPYLKIYVLGRNQRNWEHVGNTRRIRDTRYPTWPEKFSFYFDESDVKIQKILFQLWDEDIKYDDHMGNTEVMLEYLLIQHVLKNQTYVQANFPSGGTLHIYMSLKS